MTRHELRRFPEVDPCEDCGFPGSVWQTRPCQVEGCRFPKHESYLCKLCAAPARPEPSPDEYNGWVNRETWAVNLWLSNTEASDEMVREAVLLEATSGRFAVGEAVREAFDEWLADVLSDAEAINVLRDVGSQWRVDWAEIADCYLDGLDE